MVSRDVRKADAGFKSPVPQKGPEENPTSSPVSMHKTICQMDNMAEICS